MATASLELTDYSLVGVEADRAIEKGLADAAWYTSPVPRAKMRELLQRRDGPALRDTLLWFALLFVTGYTAYLLWGSAWAIVPFLLYGALYGGSSDSRWHEAGHGTAFKTDWLNNALYEIASFMVIRESTPWRWSHARHHSDTIIVGRDPEIAVPRPPHIPSILLNIFALKSALNEFRKMLLHAAGKIDAQEAPYIPKSEYGKVFFKARIYILIYASVLGLAMAQGSILPLMFVGLPSLYGAWLMVFFGITQHAGLAENVLDHRLNCRTVYMNPVFRYLYWNMNYHIEHHMFPLVPYHALPKLHALVKDDCPPAYPSTIAAYKEIIPAVWRQVKDPTYHVRRALPTPTLRAADHSPYTFIRTSADKAQAAWIEICPANKLQPEDVLRFDCDAQTFAVYRTMDDEFCATEGICTHGRTHLAEGFVNGNLIECAKHNGRFDVRDGSIQRSPVCVGLKTYTVENRAGTLFLDLESAGGCGLADAEKATAFRVLSNDNVTPFIKELVLEPENTATAFRFQPGDYIQLEIPVFESRFNTIDINEPFAKIWRDLNLYAYRASNDNAVRRNYSMANNPEGQGPLRFNVRIATPPPGLACQAGVGSTYVFNLKSGDTVKVIGPFGDFHIKDTEAEMVYVGGGAGMAPLCAHLLYLFETLKTKRKVSFWYGARSRQELFYQDSFEALAQKHDNFSFHVTLSEPLPGDEWTSHTGFVHAVLQREYLAHHDRPQALEYYLCGPPAMIDATTEMLSSLGVHLEQILFDEF